MASSNGEGTFFIIGFCGLLQVVLSIVILIVFVLSVLLLILEVVAKLTTGKANIIPAYTGIHRFQVVAGFPLIKGMTETGVKVVLFPPRHNWHRTYAIFRAAIHQFIAIHQVDNHITFFIKKTHDLHSFKT